MEKDIVSGSNIDVKLYQESGYILVPRLFDPVRIERIREEAKAIFTAQMKRLGLISVEKLDDERFTQGMYQLFRDDFRAFANCGKHAQQLISLHRLSLDARIVEIIEKLGLELPNICTRPVMFFNHPELAKSEINWRVPAHQDWRSMQGSLNSIVVWLPLVNISTSLGALEFIPGSHLRGLLTASVEQGFGLVSDYKESDFETAEIKAGDALFFSSFLIHRSGSNVSQNIRWSCHFRYNDLGEETFVDRGYPTPYTYRPEPELLTPNFPQPEQVRGVFVNG